MADDCRIFAQDPFREGPFHIGGAMTDLLDVLEARSGIVCAIGAGGKKTALYAIARHHPGRVALTTTVFTPFFPEDLEATEVIAENSDIVNRLEALRNAGRVAYACPGGKAGRHGGVNADLVRRIHEEMQFDLTLVKADGARMRWIKAPQPGEPVLPPDTDTVLVMVSARALGEPLGERIAHRPEKVSAITGAPLGEPFAPEHMAQLLTHPEGLLAGTGRTAVIPVINMVDDEDRRRLASRAAEMALEQSSRFERVVLAQMRDRFAPIVAILDR
jgi:probable selenium-dependent hydroxylase accessory protein YqeC